MKAREFDPRRLDVAAFAMTGAHRSGEWPLGSFERLLPMLVTSNVDDPVHWEAAGETVAERGGAVQVWLRVQADAPLTLRCQRCLEPVAQILRVDRRYRFVRDEDEAVRLDAEIDDDVFVLTRELDLHELVEDELLLDLPLVPRHATCPLPLPLSAAAQPEAEGDGPFAALAALRRSGP